MSTATFYPTPYGSMLAMHTYDVSLKAILDGKDVETTQMCLLNKAKDYDLIRIIEGPDDVIEIRNNHDRTYQCDRTSRCIRIGNSFFHMWENGVFDK